MKIDILSWINIRTLVTICSLLAIVAAVQSYYLPAMTAAGSEHLYPRYNNYIIFKQSYFHLVEGDNLYQQYPEESWDLYKYSPTFALFFGILAWLPDLPGLILWNLINSLFLLCAIWYLPVAGQQKKMLIVLSLLIELMTSLQNEQSNGLIAGLIIFSFGFLERNKPALASLAIVFSVFIKLFGIVALVLYLLYPIKRKLLLHTAVCIIIFFALPLLVITPDQLVFQYKSWLNLLAADHTTSYGFSVMGLFVTWFGLEVNKIMLALAGFYLMLLPLLIKYKYYGNSRFRILTLASMLIWVVIFNHKAESPTFIIAMSGIAVWFWSGRQNPLSILLFVLALIFTSLSPTDLFPRVIRETVFVPYVAKAVPCIIIWLNIVYEMMVFKTEVVSSE